MVSAHFFVNTDHTGNRATSKSQTEVLVFVNKAPILWYSKRQITDETSMFLSGFFAINTATVMVEALWYKLRMFGIPIEGSSNIF